MSKIQFESKSQLFMMGGCKYAKLRLICQRYNLKANHNINSLQSAEIELRLICQRYNLKANHNTLSSSFTGVIVAINMSKIQFESKSQR